MDMPFAGADCGMLRIRGAPAMTADYFVITPAPPAREGRRGGDKA
jgi:hypothetical protein